MADEYICELVSHGNGLWEYEPTGVQIVRCKDCKHSFDSFRGMLGCDYLDSKYPYSEDYAEFNPDDFCSKGERREDG